MATKKGKEISALPEASGLGGNEQFVLANNGGNSKISANAVKQFVQPDLTGYVEKVEGKGLSSNDFTDTLKNKLQGIAGNKLWSSVNPGNFPEIQPGDLVMSYGDTKVILIKTPNSLMCLGGVMSSPSGGSAPGILQVDKNGIAVGTPVYNRIITAADETYWNQKGCLTTVRYNFTNFSSLKAGDMLVIGGTYDGTDYKVNSQTIVARSVSLDDNGTAQNAYGQALFFDIEDTGSDLIDPTVDVKIRQVHQNSVDNMGDTKTLGQLAFKNETSKNYREVTAENIQQIKVGDTVGGVYTWDSTEHTVAPWIVFEAGPTLDDEYPYTVWALGANINSSDTALDIYKWRLKSDGTIEKTHELDSPKYKVPSLKQLEFYSDKWLGELWVKAGEWNDPSASGAGIGHVTTYINNKFYYNISTDSIEVSKKDALVTAISQKRVVGTNAESLYKDCKELRYSPVVYSNKSLDCRNMYEGCSNLERVCFKSIASLNSVDMYDIQPTITREMFKNCSNLTRIDSIINMNLVTDAEDMFYGCSSLEYINLYKLNTSVDLSYTKIDASVLRQIILDSAADHNIVIRLKTSLYDYIVTDNDPAELLYLLNTHHISLAK